MSEEHINTPEYSLKRFGIILKEHGCDVSPLKESSDSVEAILVQPENLLKICTELKNRKECLFDFLISISAVDKIKEDKIELVYHLFSTNHLHKLTLKTQLKRTNPVVDSVCDIWITADWHEREAYDLMGVLFFNHPNLTRILMPIDWIGHPLRKDYELKDERLKWNTR